MKKRLTKHGNSSALLIEKAILDLLGWNPEEQWLAVSTDGKRLIITPVAENPENSLNTRKT